MKEFGDEVDLREEYEQKPQREERQRKSDRPWSTMFAGKESSNCAFCNNLGHRHEDCKRVTDIKERKKLLLKYGRCFKCLRNGHLARALKFLANAMYVNVSIAKHRVMPVVKSLRGIAPVMVIKMK